MPIPDPVTSARDELTLVPTGDHWLADVCGLPVSELGGAGVRVELSGGDARC